MKTFLFTLFSILSAQSIFEPQENMSIELIRQINDAYFKEDQKQLQIKMDQI